MMRSASSIGCLPSTESSRASLGPRPFEETKKALYLKELQSDLARKYAKHGPAIETIWRSFDCAQRTMCIKDCSVNGDVLYHALDTFMGDTCFIMPEWNLRDVGGSDPDFLLDMLRRRATTSIYGQYCDDPVSGAPGDASFAFTLVGKPSLDAADTDSFMVFLADDIYGLYLTIPSKCHVIFDGFEFTDMDSQLVPKSTGELIMRRQAYLLQALNIMVVNILRLGSQTRVKREKVKKPAQAATAALSKLTIKAPPEKPTIPALAAASRDQQDALEEYLSLLTTDPVVLELSVNGHFYSRAELIPDEKGRRLPVYGDKYVSAALFDGVHGAIQAASNWHYVSRLLELLSQPSTDKLFRAVMLQELANMCHLEFGRAQAALKRYIQKGTGAKYFRRVPNALDKMGGAKVVMKGKPEDHTRSSPQMHYLLRLCQPETTASKAIGWVKKLGELHEAHPSDRDALFEREVDAFNDLVVIVSFMHDLATAVSLPSLSRKDGQFYISRSQALDAKMSELRKNVDLRDFVVPIENLLEPGVAADVLKALDAFVAKKAGTNMGLLYYDMVDDCVADVKERYRQAREKAEQKKREAASAKAPSAPEKPTPITHPTPKEKTRPASAATYEITPPSPSPPPTSTSPPPQTIPVSPSTLSVFTTLLDRTESRPSIPWTSFEYAMAELGFSVIPRFGSVYTFSPPEGMSVKRPVTVHRPHGARVEGYRVLLLGKRLARVYGWGKGTFVEREK